VSLDASIAEADQTAKETALNSPTAPIGTRRPQVAASTRDRVAGELPLMEDRGLRRFRIRRLHDSEKPFAAEVQAGRWEIPCRIRGMIRGNHFAFDLEVMMPGWLGLGFAWPRPPEGGPGVEAWEIARVDLTSANSGWLIELATALARFEGAAGAPPQPAAALDVRA